MSADVERDESPETVTVRYWAGARAAAGTAEDAFEVDGDVTLADLVARVLARHPDDRMARTVGGVLGARRRPTGPVPGPGDRGRRARLGGRAAAALRRRVRIRQGPPDADCQGIRLGCARTQTGVCHTGDPILLRSGRFTVRGNTMGITHSRSLSSCRWPRPPCLAWSAAVWRRWGRPTPRSWSAAARSTPTATTSTERHRLKVYDEDGDGTVEPFEYDYLDVDTRAAPSTSRSTTAPTSSSSTPAPDEYGTEYYRDKVDFATADVITVAGAAQTLAPWTIDRRPSVDRCRHHDRRSRRSTAPASTAYDAVTGSSVGSRLRPTRNGVFRIGATAPVKLVFSGNDPATGDIARDRVVQRQGVAGRRPTPSRRPLRAPTSASSPWRRAAPSPAASPTTRAPVSTAPRSCADSSGSATSPTPPAPTLIEGVADRQPRGRVRRPDRRVRRRVLQQRLARRLRRPPPWSSVGPGQAVAGIDAALAAVPRPLPPTASTSAARSATSSAASASATRSRSTTPRPTRATRKVVASTISNRAGPVPVRAARPHRRRDRVQGRGRDGSTQLAPRGGRLRSPHHLVGRQARLRLGRRDHGRAAGPGLRPARRGWRLRHGDQRGRRRAGGPVRHVLRRRPASLRRGVRASRWTASTTTRTLWAGEYTVQLGAHRPRLRVVGRRPRGRRHHHHRRARPDDHGHLRGPGQGRQGRRASRGRRQRVGRQDRHASTRASGTSRPARSSPTSGSSARPSWPPARRSR